MNNPVEKHKRQRLRKKGKGSPIKGLQRSEKSLKGIDPENQPQRLSHSKKLPNKPEEKRSNSVKHNRDRPVHQSFQAPLLVKGQTVNYVPW